MLTEADTCRKYVLPKLYAAGWTDDQISEQKSFTDGRIVVAGAKPTRRPQKRADYLLKYRRDFTLAVVEAKADYKKPGDGLQQAKEYAQILGLKFAYSTNGHGIVEHDFFTGKESNLETFPSPDELWNRLQAAENIPPEIVRTRARALLTISREDPALLPGDRDQPRDASDPPGKEARAPHSGHGLREDGHGFSDLLEALEHAVEPEGEDRRPRILYLADRNVLVDDPKDKDFAPFGDARLEDRGRERSKAAKCTSPPTRLSPKTSAVPVYTGNTQRISLT